MRIRWGLLTPVLTCVALVAAYETATSSARPVLSEALGAQTSSTATGANELAPGEFRFTTGLDKVPHYIRGPVTCDTRDDISRIAIGDQDAGGLEIGLSEDESVLKYADLGHRNGVYLALVNHGDTEGKTRPTLRKTGNTYFVSGFATGTTASQHDTGLNFEITVACP